MRVRAARGGADVRGVASFFAVGLALPLVVACKRIIVESAPGGAGVPMCQYSAGFQLCSILKLRMTTRRGLAAAAGTHRQRTHAAPLARAGARTQNGAIAACSCGLIYRSVAR